MSTPISRNVKLCLFQTKQLFLRTATFHKFTVSFLNNFLQKYHSTYRTSHSAEIAFLNVTNGILVEADTLALILFYLSAAFDHSQDLGMNVTVRFISYLVEAFRSVTMQNNTPCPQELQRGVPQGSFLGILFLFVHSWELDRTHAWRKPA